MMAFLGLVLVAFICFALVFYIKQRQYNHPALRMPYQLRRPVLQAPERELLTRLQEAVNDDYLVLCKVRIAEVVEVTAIPRRAHWYQATNRISVGCFDFLLCDPQTLDPLCAIETEPATEANAFLDELCTTIGLPLLRLPPETTSSSPELRTAIEQATAG